VVVGTRDGDEAALARLRAPLTELVARAAVTLETTLELAVGCGVIVPALDDAHPMLTPRELQIADLVAQGYSNVNVAARLALSANTVGVHVRKIYRKLGVHSRVELSDAIHRRRA
jgi:DNA-binding NarL/FixJ family response regulator